MLNYCLLGFVLLSWAYSKTAVYEYGCFDYVVIDEHEALKHIYCDPSDVFSPEEGKCITPKPGEWPCADVKNCSKAEDKRYVDYRPNDPTRNCKSYYTCQSGHFFGHNYCPGDTVFNEERQYCDWKSNVIPPCGDFQPTSSK